ncbi:DNA repair protein RecO [Sporomusa malonica]|uniref:DNA repair protein RecO n=1 Tax=Sporomusa malonica TaxID=112901 RepID=A0A1W2D9K1_9FIRM|nr:DNA repair protein RecO [Sporomusa malonica]SMC94053.1 DNA replication and repair protein RecO [Sporomusa malonica]
MAVEYQTEAILLAARDWSDADRVVTLFSREYGIVTAMAYGARKPKSKLGGSLQPFSHLSLAMATGKGMDAIKQCEVQTSFRKIKEDLTRLAYANFIAELTTGLWPERQSEPEVFDSLLSVLNLIAIRNPRIAALTGAWHLMVLAGFQPEYERCARCGRELKLPAHFSFLDGGGICSECSLPSAVEFEQSDKDFLDKLFAIDLNAPGQFVVSAKTLASAERLLYGFVRYQLERPLKSLDFINRINAL